MHLPQEQTLDHILPDLRDKAVSMDSLILDPENANKHNQRNLLMIATSLKDFGQRTPLTVNRKTNFIQKGNGTYMAAKMLGWAMIAVVWTEDEPIRSKAYGLIDNRTGQTSTTDYSRAGKTLRELNKENYPMLAFWSPEEAMPLIRGEFVKAEISDEKFDPGLQKGRAVTKISASERIAVDRAIAFVRSKDKKFKTEGAALEYICGVFMAGNINEIDNSTEEAMGLVLSLED
jgi:hypothetical protein